MIDTLRKLLNITLIKPYFMIKTTDYVTPRPVIEGKIIGTVSQNGTIIGLMVKQGQRITMVKYQYSV
jgi:hypothetical protein